MYDTLKTERDCRELLTPVQLLEFPSGNSDSCNVGDDVIPPVPATPSNRQSLNSKDTCGTTCIGCNIIHQSHTNWRKRLCPFRDRSTKHLKGLSDFVHFTDNLEELLGEIPDPRSSEPSTGSPPKSLQYRVLEHEGKTTPKAKGNPIRSQFACTYRDDPLVNKKLPQFPSLSQVPTCVHPVSKRALVPVLCFDNEPSTANVTENETLIIERKRPAFGSISGNTQQKGNSRKKGSETANGQPGNKICKRKQVYVNDENANCSHENEPPQKRAAGGPKVSDKPQNKLDCKTGAPRKGSKAVAKKRLIAGQGKLTNFFRL